MTVPILRAKVINIAANNLFICTSQDATQIRLGGELANDDKVEAKVNVSLK